MRFDSTIVAAFIGVAGSVIGGFIASLLTNKTTKNVTQKNIDAQNRVLNENKSLQALEEQNKMKIRALVTYNDILNSCYEGLQFLKNNMKSSIVGPSPISINKNYTEDVSFLSSILTMEEVVLVFNLYGLLEKIRNDIIKSDYAKGNFFDVEYDYRMLVEIVFKDKFKEIENRDSRMITKDYLLDCMNKEYKFIFQKLLKEFSKNDCLNQLL